MHIPTLILGVATAVGTAGQFLDVFTTNYGVNITKVAVEGNSAAKGIVAHPILDYILKVGFPLACGIMGVFLVPYLVGYPEAGDAQIFFSVTLVAAGVWGFFAAKGNAKINGGWHL